MEYSDQREHNTYHIGSIEEDDRGRKIIPKKGVIIFDNKMNKIDSISLSKLKEWVFILEQEED